MRSVCILVGVCSLFSSSEALAEKAKYPHIAINNSLAITSWDTQDNDDLAVFTAERSLTIPNNLSWFPQQQRSSSSNPISFKARIALNSKGEGILAWETNVNNTSTGNIYVSERDANGNWSAQKRIDQAALDDAESPQVAISENGLKLACWYSFGIFQDTKEFNSYAAAKVNGIWIDQVLNRVSLNKALKPKVAVNNQDISVFIWETNENNTSQGNIEALIRTADGIYQEEKQVNAKNSGSFNISESPVVAISNTNLIVAAWNTDSTQGKSNIYVSTYNGNKWSEEKIISLGETSNISQSPQVVINNNDEIIVTWATNLPGTSKGNVYVVTKTPNSDWSKPIRINGSLSESICEAPNIALNDSGKACICWYTYDSSTRDSNIFASIKQNGSWNTETLLSTIITTNRSSSPTVAINDNNKVIVNWYAFDTSFQNSNIYASIEENGIWSNEILVNTDSVSNDLKIYELWEYNNATMKTQSLLN